MTASECVPAYGRPRPPKDFGLSRSGARPAGCTPTCSWQGGSSLLRRGRRRSGRPRGRDNVGLHLGASVVGGFAFVGWDVVELAVQAAVVEPVDPLHRGVLDVV